MPARLPILLIHGACHGSWCWDYLTPHLEQRGYHVHAIDLPGRNPSPALGWGLRLKQQAAAVAAKAAAIGGPVIAVAHSMGGLAMSAAAEMEPSFFSRLIYLTAYIPSAGDNLIAVGRRDTGSRVNAATRISLSGFVSIRPEKSEQVFYHDCSADQIDRAKRLLVREPLRAAFDRLSLSKRFASVPRSYVRCSADRVLTPRLQDLMIATNPCDKIATLESSHSPFLSMPERLAQAIEDVR